MKPLFMLSCMILVLVIIGCSSVPKPKTVKTTFSSFDLPSDHPDSEVLPAGTVNFQGLDIGPVLEIYAELAKRTVVRGPLPNANINLRSSTPMSRVEMLQLFDTVLAQNGVVMIYVGDKVVKAVPASQALSESPPKIDLPWQELPDSSSYMTRIVHLKGLKAMEMVPVLAPLSKLPGSIIVLQKDNLLIISDYSSNIKQELRLLEELEKTRAH